MNPYREIRASLTVGSTNQKENEAFIKGRQNNQGRTTFYPGQWVNGLVTEVSDSISLRIGNQAVNASREINPQAVPGDWMMFEVLEVLDNKIIMGLAGSEISQKRALVTLMRPDSERESFLSRKAQSDKQSEQDKEYRNNRDKIDSIVNRMTVQDYKRLEEEGFSIEDFTVSGLEAALGRMKGSSAEDKGQKIEAKDITAGQGDMMTVEDIKQRMIEANIPITEENVQKVLTAFHMYKSLPMPEDGTIYHLVSKALPPTIGNIYKAQHSNITTYDKVQLDEKAWKELIPQVKEVITAAGYEVNDENLNRAMDLLEHGVPLTIESYKYYSNLKEFSKPGEHLVLDNMLEGMGEGISPNDTILTDYSKESLEEMVSKLMELGPEEINETLREGKKLTLKELIYHKQENETSDQASKKELTLEQQLEAVRALRQLEEIRLRMTVEAAARLERRGYHIETQPLEEVVQELRGLEEEYLRKQLAEADIMSTPEQIEILRSMNESMEQLKSAPSYILGSTLHLRNQVRIPTLLEEGHRLSIELSKANEAYESLMTQPSREYGDSIQKAFDNSASMLKELGLEDTIYNSRAIRILGYNQMEITREAIEEVKAYDIKVNNLIKNLHPAVTVRMIKDGINPLELPIDEINQRIDDIRDEQGITEEERFGTFLRRLDKEKGLSENERKAYIGIYRLLHNIDKSDGAALGAVMKAGMEVTLSHLLTAVRSFQKGSIDTRVNDQFGALESISFDKEAISEQINAGFRNGSEENRENDQTSSDSFQAAKQEFTVTAVEQLLSGLTPEFINMLHNDTSMVGQPLLSSDKGIWGAVKDLPLETLLDQLINLKGMETEESAAYETKVQELRQIYQNSDQAIRFLEDFKLPCTTTNLLMAGEILNNGSTLFRRLQLHRDETSKGNSHLPLKEREDLADTLIDKESMNETYEQLETEVKSMIESELLSDRIDAKRLFEFKHIGAQISLMKTLAKKEFYQIPIETTNGITNINLTVIRGTKKVGKVTVSLQSERLGKVKADLYLKDKEINGFIASDSRRGCELLQDVRQELSNRLEDDSMTMQHLEVCFSSVGKEPYSYQHPEDEDKKDNDNPEMERALYRLAKLMVNLIQKAESTEME